jgi:MFS family permease
MSAMTPPPAHQSLPVSTGTRALGVAALSLGTIAVQFDSAVNIAFPDLVRSFALPIPEIQWIVISYTLTYAALMLVFGRIGDIFGHRAIFLLGAAGSALAFVLCALATTYNGLLAARVLQGVSAALTLSCGPALITSLYAEERRAQVLSIYTLLIGLGGALGPVIGGFLVDRWGWPSVFVFRAPIALVALALLLVLTISMALLALNQLQRPERMLISAGLFGAVVLLGFAFARCEARVRHPIIDVRFFRDADFALLNAAHTLLNLAGFAIFLLAPFYLDAIGGLSAPVAGLVLAASPVGLIRSTDREPHRSRRPSASHGPDRCHFVGNRTDADKPARLFDRGKSKSSCRPGSIDAGVPAARLRCGSVPGRLFRHRHGNLAEGKPRRRRQPRADDAHRWPRHGREYPDAGFPQSQWRCQPGREAFPARRLHRRVRHCCLDFVYRRPAGLAARLGARQATRDSRYRLI